MIYFYDVLAFERESSLKMPEIVTCQSCSRETYAGMKSCPHCGALGYEHESQNEQDTYNIIAEHPLTKMYMEPAIKVSALAGIIRNHSEDVQAGLIKCPAHRHGESVLDIWTNLRIEAFRQLFGFGLADPFKLAEVFNQLEVISCFLDDRPHLDSMTYQFVY